MKELTNFFLVLICMFILAEKSYAKEYWDLSIDFDEIQIGKKAKGEDGFYGGAGHTVIQNSIALKDKAAKLSIKKGQTGYGNWGGDWSFPPVKRGDTIWYSVHLYFPKDFDHYSYNNGNRLKLMRIQTKSNTGKHEGYVDFLINIKGKPNPFRWIFEGQQEWVDVGIKEDLIVPDTWENYQMAVTFDSKSKSDGGDAEVKIWKDGKLLVNILDKKTLASPSSIADRALLFTYWNGGAPKDQFMFVDQVRITNKEPEWKDSNGFNIVPFYTDLCRLVEK